MVIEKHHEETFIKNCFKWHDYFWYTMTNQSCLSGWINCSFRIWYLVKTTCVDCSFSWKKKSALSQQWINTCYSLRRRRSDRSNLATETHGQNKLVRHSKVQQTIFIDVDYTRWDYTSASSFVWRTDWWIYPGAIGRTQRSPSKWFSMMQTQAEPSKSFLLT